MKNKITFNNIKSYIQGNLIYNIYYSKFKNLIPKHIRQQIHMRILIMNKKCYDDGQCVVCGCKTTALQMCTKPCDGGCYPKLVSKRKWNEFKRNKILKEGNHSIHIISSGGFRYYKKYKIVVITSEHGVYTRSIEIKKEDYEYLLEK